MSTWADVDRWILAEEARRRGELDAIAAGDRVRLELERREASRIARMRRAVAQLRSARGRQLVLPAVADHEPRQLTLPLPLR